jgi:hypothetical protein
MRFTDFFEAVRMGKRELSSPPKKNYTIGFEFEILADGSNYDPSDEYERFSENWHNNNDADFETYFNDHWMNSRISLKTLNRELGFDLQPKFGWASEYEFEKTMNSVWYADSITNPERKQEAIELNKLSDNVDNLTKEEIESTFKRISSMLEYSEMYSRLEPDSVRKNKIDNLYDIYKNNNTVLIYRIKHLPRELKFIDEMNFDKEESTGYYWGSEDKDRAFNDISTLDDIVNYFFDGEEEISRESIEEMLNDDYYEWLDEQVQHDFNEHMRYNHGPVGEIADDLENYVDQDIVKHSSYHESSKDSKKWTVEPDNSIEGAEVVSPVFDNLDEAFKNMHNVFDMISTSYDTDSTTGLHVNIGTFSDEEMKKLDLLKFLLIVGGENILKDFDRMDNDYTADNMKKVYSYLSGETMETSAIQKINLNIIHNSRKMELFNFSKFTTYGYIEVRGFGNAGYEKKGELIENYVRKILRSLDIAMDPNAYKDTYMKYLAKAIDKANPSKFSTSDNRILEKYKKEFNNLTNNSYRFRPYHISEDVAESYRLLMNTILKEEEYDMVTANFYTSMSNLHAIMKNKDDGDYRKFLGSIIREFKPIIAEFRNLSSKKDRSSEESDRLQLITPVGKILKILVN